MKRFVIIFALLLASCSGDSMDISGEVSTYDVNIIITKEYYSKTFRTLQHTEVDVKAFTDLTRRQLDEVLATYPEGTVTYDGTYQHFTTVYDVWETTEHNFNN